MYLALCIWRNVIRVRIHERCALAKHANHISSICVRNFSWLVPIEFRNEIRRTHAWKIPLPFFSATLIASERCLEKWTKYISCGLYYKRMCVSELFYGPILRTIENNSCAAVHMIWLNQKQKWCNVNDQNHRFFFRVRNKQKNNNNNNISHTTNSQSEAKICLLVWACHRKRTHTHTFGSNWFCTKYGPAHMTCERFANNQPINITSGSARRIHCIHNFNGLVWFSGWLERIGITILYQQIFDRNFFALVYSSAMYRARWVTAKCRRKNSWQISEKKTERTRLRLIENVTENDRGKLDKARNKEKERWREEKKPTWSVHTNFISKLTMNKQKRFHSALMLLTNSEMISIHPNTFSVC